VIRPGDVVWVDLDPARGREQGGRRPAVVVSSADHLAAATTLVSVVPATSRNRGWPNHVALQGGTGLDVATFAMTEQVRTIARGRVVGTSGEVEEASLDEICEWVRRWLA
jgi:mRNA interferase MazF